MTATFAPAEKYVVGPHAGGYERRHERYCTPELVADALGPYGFEPVRHDHWSFDDDRLLVCVLAGR